MTTAPGPTLTGHYGGDVASALPIEYATPAALETAGVASVNSDDETGEERLARRKARWTPTVLVEASPSA